MNIGEILGAITGKTLRSEDLKGQKFNVFWGLPIMSSDAISSVAYAGEEILIVLIPFSGMMSYKYMLYVSMCIVFLMFMLVFSYSQTIDAYPGGGGSYIVAKDNLGTVPGLVAGASLTIDYILTVAVSTTAGTAAITSAFPVLLPHAVSITLFLILFLVVGNLKGIKDSSQVFGIPTYVFIFLVLVMIVWGIIRVHLTGYIPKMQYDLPKASETVTAFLFLRAFASGCTALTGIEAVSNGVPNFKKPSQKNAKTVLFLLGITMFLMFGGISYLSTIYHAVPNSNVTVLAQISSQVFNGNIIFYLIQVSTAIILIMAGNTSFAGLPLLLALMAKDGYAPRQFAKRGRRLNYSNGIIVLGFLSAVLVVIFNGDTHYLLPLYAVGVFISFTLSQWGMLKRWIKNRGSGWKHRAFINGTGAVLTFATMIIIGITRFIKGAWIIFVLIPAIVLLMCKIKKHYDEVAVQLRLPVYERPKNINLKEQKKYVIVPIDTLNRSFLKALNYARTISQNIIVFHVSIDDSATAKLLKKWEEYNVKIPIVVKKSPYRSIIKPLVKFIESEEYTAGEDDTITIVIPQFIVTKWWGNILHNQTAVFIKTVLLKKRNIAVVTIPYIINEN